MAPAVLTGPDKITPSAQVRRMIDERERAAHTDRTRSHLYRQRCWRDARGSPSGVRVYEVENRVNWERFVLLRMRPFGSQKANPRHPASRQTTLGDWVQ